MCKPKKLLSQQNEIKDNFKNLTFWGFTLTSTMQKDIESYHRVSDMSCALAATRGGCSIRKMFS